MNVYVKGLSNYNRQCNSNWPSERQSRWQAKLQMTMLCVVTSMNGVILPLGQGENHVQVDFCLLSGVSCQFSVIQHIYLIGVSLLS